MVSDVLGKVIPHAKTLIASNEVVNQLDEKHLVFIGSGNGNLKLNKEVKREQFSEISANKEASFALRLIALPKTVVNQLKAGYSPQGKNNLETVEKAPVRWLDMMNINGRRTTFAGFGWDAQILNDYDRLFLYLTKYQPIRKII